MKYKNVFITGGAGFIGSNLALALVTQDCRVTVLDNLSPQVHGDDPENKSPLYLSIRDKVKFIKADVRNAELLTSCLQDADVVVHFAAETGTGQSMYQIAHYIDVNIGATALLLDILTNQSTDVKKIIVASSRAIYGEGKYHLPGLGNFYPSGRNPADMMNGRFEVTLPGQDTVPEPCATDEASAIHPSSIYGISKQTQEQLVLTAARSLNIPAVALRYQNVYGPGQSLSNPYTGILSIFSTQIRNGNPINIFEDGLESRDFIFIDDVIKATILAINSDGVGQEAYNVGSGVATSVTAVADTLIKHYNKRVPVNVSGNFRVGDIRHNFADLRKIQEQLGFEPQISFSDGIRKFCDWVNTQELQSSRYEHSLQEMQEKGLLK